MPGTGPLPQVIAFEWIYLSVWKGGGPGTSEFAAEVVVVVVVAAVVVGCG